jgi:dihydrofolate reductase
MSIKLICAVSKNNVIGNDNKLPWNISEDLKRFRELTSENIVVMGRKTYDSIGRPLPKRENLVLSKNKKLKIENVKVFNTPREILDFYDKREEKKDLFIIGGTFIYKLFIEYCDYLLITFVDKEYDGDAYFPKIDWAEWELTNEERKTEDQENLTYYFRDYKKI